MNILTSKMTVFVTYLVAIAIMVPFPMKTYADSDSVIISPARVTSMSNGLIIETSELTGNPKYGKAAAFTKSMYYGVCQQHPDSTPLKQAQLVLFYEAPSEQIEPLKEFRRYDYESLTSCTDAISNLIEQYRSKEALLSRSYNERGAFLVALFFHELPDGQVPAVILSKEGIRSELGRYRVDTPSSP